MSCCLTLTLFLLSSPHSPPLTHLHRRSISRTPHHTRYTLYIRASPPRLSHTQVVTICDAPALHSALLCHHHLCHCSSRACIKLLCRLSDTSALSYQRTLSPSITIPHPLINMSSNKMEQSLDDILKASKTSRRGRAGRRSGAGRPAAAPAPVGGVSKSTKQGKQAKAAPTAPAASLGGETKIMVSNLVCASSRFILDHANTQQPRDIDQTQLQVCKTDAGL